MMILRHPTNLDMEVDVARATAYGMRYEIRMVLQTPIAGHLPLRTIWQIDDGVDYPRLITLYPD